MKSNMLSPIPTPAALSPLALVEMELEKDRWDAHTIPGLRYAPHIPQFD